MWLNSHLEILYFLASNILMLIVTILYILFSEFVSSRWSLFYIRKYNIIFLMILSAARASKMENLFIILISASNKRNKKNQE